MCAKMLLATTLKPCGVIVSRSFTCLTVSLISTAMLPVQLSLDYVRFVYAELLGSSSWQLVYMPTINKERINKERRITANTLCNNYHEQPRTQKLIF
jgi:hypothetical protein